MSAHSETLASNRAHLEGTPMSSAHQSGTSCRSSNCESGDFARRCRRLANSATPWATNRFPAIAAIAALVAFIVVPVMEAHGSEPLTLYVATCGNDAWSGKLAQPNAEQRDGPFATIERARDEIRRMKTGGGLPKEGMVVEILGGRYELVATSGSRHVAQFRMVSKRLL
jgi:hypothetical protein